jgi:F0F1-type ATP synthase gamma subunit
MTGINQIFQQVKVSYIRETRGHDFSWGRKNGKTARVFISANTGLFGEIVKKTFALFWQDIRKEGGEVIITGRMGKMLFDEISNPPRFVYFDLDDDEVDYREMQKIVAFLAHYSKVVVYHGLYKTLITSEAISANITGGELVPKGEQLPPKKSFIEPSLPGVLNFFETEIFASLFVHSIHESQLAKFASRMVALDQAVDNIKKAINASELCKGRLRHREANRRQLAAFSGIALWEES